MSNRHCLYGLYKMCTMYIIHRTIEWVTISKLEQFLIELNNEFALRVNFPFLIP